MRLWGKPLYPASKSRLFVLRHPRIFAEAFAFSCSLHLTNRTFRVALPRIFCVNQIRTDTMEQQASAIHFQHAAFCPEANSLFTDYLSCYDSPWHIMSSRGARVWQSAFPDGQQLLTRVSEVLIMHLQDLAWANTWLNGLDWREQIACHFTCIPVHMLTPCWDKFLEFTFTVRYFNLIWHWCFSAPFQNLLSYAYMLTEVEPL